MLLGETSNLVKTETQTHFFFQNSLEDKSSYHILAPDQATMLSSAAPTSVPVAEVDIPGAGLHVCAVDIIAGICQKDRRAAQITISNLLKNSRKEEAQAILHRTAKFPGFRDPTYAITYDECVKLLRLLPAQYTRDALDFIDRQFARQRAGDQSLHAEIDAQAANDGLEARLARDEVGLSARLACSSDFERDPEVVAIKKQRLMIAMENDKTEMVRSRVEMLKGLMTEEDDRDKMMIKDFIYNQCFSTSVIPAVAVMQGIPTAIEANTTKEEITISDIVVKLGKKPEKRVLMALGRLIAKRYRERNDGNGPPKCKRWVDGAQRDVGYYCKKDEQWIYDVCSAYFADGLHTYL